VLSNCPTSSQPASDLYSQPLPSADLDTIPTPGSQTLLQANSGRFRSENLHTLPCKEGFQLKGNKVTVQAYDKVGGMMVLHTLHKFEARIISDNAYPNVTTQA
jgi:hypothetical protein